MPILIFSFEATLHDRTTGKKKDSAVKVRASNTESLRNIVIDVVHENMHCCSPLSIPSRP